MQISSMRSDCTLFRKPKADSMWRTLIIIFYFPWLLSEEGAYFTNGNIWCHIFQCNYTGLTTCQTTVYIVYCLNKYIRILWSLFFSFYNSSMLCCITLHRNKGHTDMFSPHVLMFITCKVIYELKFKPLPHLVNCFSWTKGQTDMFPHIFKWHF